MLIDGKGVGVQEWWDQGLEQGVYFQERDGRDGIEVDMDLGWLRWGWEDSCGFYWRCTFLFFSKIW